MTKLDALLTEWGARLMGWRDEADGGSKGTKGVGGPHLYNMVRQAGGLTVAGWEAHVPSEATCRRAAKIAREEWAHEAEEDGYRSPLRDGELPGQREAHAQRHALEVDSVEPDPGYEYDYREDRREYVFTFPGAVHPVIVGESALKQMLVDYTSWSGASANMDQVALAHNLTRGEFYGIKRAMGWTKTTPPLLPHELDQMDDDELAGHLKQLKLRKAVVKANRDVWREVEAKAAKWDALERGEIKPLEEVINRAAEHYQPPGARMTVRPRFARRYALVVNPTDLHVGKLHSPVSGGRDRAGLGTARERLVYALTDLLSMLPGPPELIYYCVGGDWFNVDNDLGTTTRGTPQDNASVPAEVWVEGSTLARDTVQLLADVAPVQVVHVPGNHDRSWGQHLADFLAAWFRTDERVTVLEERTPYVARTYGANFLMWAHGDGVHKAPALAQLMADTWPRLWGESVWRYVMVGHHHHAEIETTRRRRPVADVRRPMMKEDAGITKIRMSSLSADDRYHSLHGYTTSHPALMALAYDFDRGLFAVLNSTARVGRAS